MKLLKNDPEYAEIEFPIEELYHIHQCFNEICNGIDIFEFETRVGTNKQNIINLMNSFKEVINTMNIE